MPETIDAEKISDAFAEHLCTWSETLKEIDLESLDRRIARLQQLREAVLRLRGGVPAAQPVPALVPYQAPKRKPRGYWRNLCEQVLRGGPSTVRAIARASGGDSDIARQTVYNVLAKHPALFAQQTRDGVETVWTLRHPPEEARTA